MDVKRAVELGDRDVGDVPEREDAGVVDEDVDASERLNRVLDGSSSGVCVSSVAAQSDGPAALSSDGGDDLVGARLLLPVANADAYTDPHKPTGCLIVLGASTWTDGNESVRAHLSDLRRHTREAIEARVRRGVQDGDLRPDTDAKALSRYFATVQEGLSLQARDGATREDLHATIDVALHALRGDEW